MDQAQTRAALDQAQRALRDAQAQTDAAFRSAHDALSAAEIALEGPFKSTETLLQPDPHRAAHRRGHPSRIDQDRELRAFVIARIQHRTFEQLEADIAAAFPPGRRTSKSALHRWWHRNLASFGIPDGSV